MSTQTQHKSTAPLSTRYTPVSVDQNYCDSTLSREQLIPHPIPLWKRLFDIAGSLVLIMLLSPLLFLVAVYIRCVSKGPALFTQSRLGELGEYFTIYKFRTLHLPKPSSGELDTDSKHRQYVSGLSRSSKVLEKPDISERMIPGGEFLRSSSIDELPQLLNVLLGSMSLVGPRPDVLNWEDYPAWQLRRFEARPGMTGLWQVSGKNKLTYAQMVRLDLQYIERCSLLLDLKILWKTAKLVVSRTND